MKKAIQSLKKHDILLITMLIAIMLLSNVFNIFLTNNDELINFLNTYKIANGLTIYKDTNVIITPLFFYIGKIFLGILGSNFLVYRVYNLILMTILYVLCYKILKTLKMTKQASLLYTLLIMLFTSEIAQAGANYNVLAYIFFELGLLFNLKNEENRHKNIFQGIILFLVFISNQKLAAGYLLAMIFCQIYNKNIKALIKQLFIAGILTTFFLLHLLIQNNLYNFINYTMFGISEFRSENTVFSKNILLPGSIFIFFTIITILLYNVIIKIEKSKKVRKELTILLIFSLCSLILLVPIFNVYHLKLACICLLINVAYDLHYLVYPIIEKKMQKIILKVAILIISIYMIIISTLGFYNYIKQMQTTSIFYGSIIEEQLQKEIETVSQYIKNNNKDTIVFSTYAPFYSLTLNDLDNNVYDWPFKGNLGKDGEKGLLEKIKKLKNTQILLLSDEKNEIFQISDKSITYIKENMKYIGKIENFDIYQTID